MQQPANDARCAKNFASAAGRGRLCGGQLDTPCKVCSPRRHLPDPGSAGASDLVSAGAHRGSLRIEQLLATDPFVGDMSWCVVEHCALFPLPVCVPPSSCRTEYWGASRPQATAHVVPVGSTFCGLTHTAPAADPHTLSPTLVRGVCLCGSALYPPATRRAGGAAPRGRRERW